MSHTLGQWETRVIGFATFIGTKDQPNVAAVHGAGMPEGDANAHLIAAAPDLLEACKKLLNAPHYDHFAVQLNDEEMAGLDAIKAAIAKAEGR